MIYFLFIGLGILVSFYFGNVFALICSLAGWGVLTFILMEPKEIVWRDLTGSDLEAITENEK